MVRSKVWGRGVQHQKAWVAKGSQALRHELWSLNPLIPSSRGEVSKNRDDLARHAINTLHKRQQPPLGECPANQIRLRNFIHGIELYLVSPPHLHSSRLDFLSRAVCSVSNRVVLAVPRNNSTHKNKGFFNHLRCMINTGTCISLN